MHDGRFTGEMVSDLERWVTSPDDGHPLVAVAAALEVMVLVAFGKLDALDISRAGPGGVGGQQDVPAVAGPAAVDPSPRGLQARSDLSG